MRSTRDLFAMTLGVPVVFSNDLDGTTVNTGEVPAEADGADDAAPDGEDGASAGEESGEESASGSEAPGDVDEASVDAKALLEEIQSLKGELGGANEKIEKLLNSSSGDSNPKGGNDGNDVVKDLLAMESEDLSDLMRDDPHKFLSTLVSGLSQKIGEDVVRTNVEEDYNRKVESTYESYAEQNEDFSKMWDSGEIKSFIEKNPGHNAISAHMAMTVEKRIEQAKAEAFKEGEDKTIKNFKEKGFRSRVLDGGSSTPPGDSNKALQNTSKYGGAAAVIASRLSS